MKSRMGMIGPGALSRQPPQGKNGLYGGELEAENPFTLLSQGGRS